MIRDFDPRTDLQDCVAMAVDLLTEAPGYAGCSIDENTIAVNMRRFDVKGWVSERDGELNGYCFAAVVPTFHGPDRICTDLSIYVKPKARNGFIAVRLVRRMEAWGKAMGAVRHVHAVSTGVSAAGFYAGLGYVSMGGVYVKSAS